MSLLITGTAGFIGAALASRLLRDGESVFGIDNLSPYYDVKLKEARLGQLQRQRGFRFEPIDIADRAADGRIVRARALRADCASGGAGRGALLAGTAAELCRQQPCRVLSRPRRRPSATCAAFHVRLDQRSLRRQRKLPFAESDNVDHPITLYGATKKANELTAHSYAHLYGCRVPGCASSPSMVRGCDPTWRCSSSPGRSSRARACRSTTPAGWCGTSPTSTMSLRRWCGCWRCRPPPARPAMARLRHIGSSISAAAAGSSCSTTSGHLEAAFDREAELQLLPMQPGDMAATMADVTRLEHVTGYRPTTTVQEGVRRFVDWYVARYGAAPSEPGTDSR